MRIELVNTGSELLLGFTVNTHLNYIARQLARIGLRLERQTTVGDGHGDLRVVIAEALARADVLLITGGLGPTSDDCTRDIVAELLNLPLVRDEVTANAISERFRRRNLSMPEQIMVQALVPQGASVLPNRNGTAPGLAVSQAGKLVILLPGPPRELKPMFEEYVLPLLPAGTAMDCRVFKVAGLPESIVEQKVAPRLADLPDLELGYCARPGEVEVRVIATPATNDEAEHRIRTALGQRIYGVGDELLEQVVVRLLTQAGKTLAVAESCTGGAIANRLTNVSGASAVFLSGWVTYSNLAKMRDLGVREVALQQFGAVSEEVALAMAEGARQRGRADYALSATGIAGPTGATPEKPVGLVFIGLATPAGTTVERHSLSFDRETFKWFVSQAALDLLRRALVS